MHPFDLPKPLSDKSTSVLLDLAALHVSIVNHPSPNRELAIRPTHLAFLLSPNFLPRFHLQRVHRLLPVYCSGDMPLAISSGISTSLCKIIAPPPPPSHIDTRSSLPSSFVQKTFAALPLLRLRAPVDSTCAMTLFDGRLPLMVHFRRAGTTSPFKSVDSTTSPATSFVYSSKSEGASCASFSGSDGPSHVSSSGSDGASRVSSSGSDDTSRVSFL